MIADYSQISAEEWCRSVLLQLNLEILSAVDALAAGFFAGAVLGTATGLLLAPRPGRQTRHEIKHKTARYRGALRARFKANKVTDMVIDPSDYASEATP